MKDGLFKKRLIYFILLNQFLTLLLVIVLYLLGGFDQPEFFDLLYIDLPVSLVYLSLGFIFIKNNRYLPNTAYVEQTAVYTAYAIIGLCFSGLAFIVILKAFYNLISIEMLKMLLCGINCFAGIYATTTISKLLNNGKTEDLKG